MAGYFCHCSRATWNGQPGYCCVDHSNARPDWLTTPGQGGNTLGNGSPGSPAVFPAPPAPPAPLPPPAQPARPAPPPATALQQASKEQELAASQRPANAIGLVNISNCTGRPNVMSFRSQPGPEAKADGNVSNNTFSWLIAKEQGHQGFYNWVQKPDDHSLVYVSARHCTEYRCSGSGGGGTSCCKTCSRKPAGHFPTCCRRCPGGHSPNCDQNNGIQPWHKPAAPPAPPPPSPPFVGGTLCCKTCSRKPAGRFPTCCRRCPGGHSPDCDQNNPAPPPAGGRPAPVQRMDYGPSPPDVPGTGGTDNDFTKDSVYPISRLQGTPIMCSMRCGRIPQLGRAGQRLEKCCRDCRGQGSHSHQCNVDYEAAKACHARNYFGECMTSFPPPTATTPTPSEPSKVIITGNVTSKFNQGTTEWVKNLASSGGFEAKASSPAFNIAQGKYDIGVDVEQYDAPCFGPEVTQAIMSVLECPGLKQTAKTLGVRLPAWSVNDFVQERVARVEEMLTNLPQDIHDQIGAASMQKLRHFVGSIRRLSPSDFVSHPGEQLVTILDNLVGVGWKQHVNNLHISNVLSLFGIRQDVSDRIVQLTHPEIPTMTWGDYAVKWLAKGFGVFGFTGSPADIVNMIHIIMQKPIGRVDQVIQVVKDFARLLKENKLPLGNMWIPTHMVHDAELDDVMAWVLLYHIRVSIMGRPAPKVLVQLPGYEEFKRLRDWFIDPAEVATRGQHHIFFDSEAKNMKAIRLWWGTNIKELYIASPTDVRCFVGKYRGEIGYKYVGVHTEGNKVGQKNGRQFRRLGDGKWAFSLKAAAEKHGDRVWLLKSVVTSANWPSSVGEEEWQLLNVADNYYSMIPRYPRGMAPIIQDPIVPGPDDLPTRPAHWIPLSGGFTMSMEVPKCSKCKSTDAVTDGLTHCEGCRSKPHPKTEACPKYQEADLFIRQQLPDLEPFRDPAKDRCFCETCYPDTQAFPDVIFPEGGQAAGFNEYLVPRGWVGMGIAIPQDTINWKWPSVYHGTYGPRASDILSHRHIGMPGDRLPDGTLLRAAHSAGRDDEQFCTSKTINYAGLQMYAAATAWGKDEDPNLDSRATQVVLQCKQDLSSRTKPGATVRFQPETMGFEEAGYTANSVCRNVDLYDRNSGIEILSKDPKSCVPYRLLLRTFPGNPAAPPTKGRHFAGLETFRSPNDPSANMQKGTLRGVGGIKWY